MKLDSFSAICVLDFAEKFEIPQQNATQAAHYGQEPISLFT